MAERTSVLLAWHLASELELFLSVSPPSHCRKINFDSVHMKLSDVLVTSYVRALGGLRHAFVGRFLFYPQHRRARGRRSTLKSLKLFAHCI